MSEPLLKILKEEIAEDLPRLKDSHEGEEKLTRLAIDTLNGNLALSKEWAADLEISPGMISQWLRGEKKIPEERAKQILIIGKKYCMRNQKIEQAIDFEIMKIVRGNF
jgi:hypothetical protein